MDNLERGVEKGASHEKQSQIHWSQGSHQRKEAAALLPTSDVPNDDVGKWSSRDCSKHLLTSLTFDYLNWSRGSDQEPSVGFIDDCTVKEMLLKYKMK